MTPVSEPETAWPLSNVLSWSKAEQTEQQQGSTFHEVPPSRQHIARSRRRQNPLSFHITVYNRADNASMYVYFKRRKQVKNNPVENDNCSAARHSNHRASPVEL